MAVDTALYTSALDDWRNDHSESDKRDSSAAVKDQLPRQAGLRIAKKELRRRGLLSLLGFIFVWLVLAGLTLSQYGEPLDACGVRANPIRASLKPLSSVRESSAPITYIAEALSRNTCGCGPLHLCSNLLRSDAGSTLGASDKEDPIRDA